MQLINTLLENGQWPPWKVLLEVILVRVWKMFFQNQTTTWTSQAGRLDWQGNSVAANENHLHKRIINIKHCPEKKHSFEWKMTDVFNSRQAVDLLKGKTILFLGASVTRGLYKDLIWLLNSVTLLPRQILGQKGEASFPDFTKAGGEEKFRFRFRDQLQEDFFGTEISKHGSE